MVHSAHIWGVKKFHENCNCVSRQLAETENARTNLETTLDQLFTEEQYEAYRALGFHAVNSAFNLTDKVSMNPEAIVWEGDTSKIPLEVQMRQILS
jgi:hypothetical protein